MGKLGGGGWGVREERGRGLDTSNEAKIFMEAESLKPLPPCSAKGPYEAMLRLSRKAALILKSISLHEHFKKSETLIHNLNQNPITPKIKAPP